MATKLEGGGDKASVAGPLKKELFCGFPKRILRERERESYTETGNLEWKIEREKNRERMIKTEER